MNYNRQVEKMIVQTELGQLVIDAREKDDNAERESLWKLEFYFDKDENNENWYNSQPE